MTMTTDRRTSAANRGAPQPPGGPEGGSTSLELVVIAPALLLIMVAVIAGGRLALAQQSVGLAAGQGARAATLALAPAAGAAAGRQAAQSALAAHDLDCQPGKVDVEASALAAGPGVPGQVTVAVACTVRMADLGAPGLPGAVTVRGSAQEVVDRWLAR